MGGGGLTGSPGGRLRDAVGRGELALDYEPVFDTVSRRPVAFEALPRWRRTNRLLERERFLPLAERVGMGAELDDRALAAAVRQLAAWSQAGLGEPTVAVNLSPESFVDPALPRRVAELTRREGVPRGGLELEVSERVAMRDPAAAGAAFERLSELGVGLAIDDFGTAYSSLLYLRSFALHTLKLDRSFVRDLAEQAADQEIAASLVRLAHTLGMRVVATGVEKAAQLDALARLGCDRVQGPWLAPPASVAECTRLLERDLRRPASCDSR